MIEIQIPQLDRRPERRASPEVGRVDFSAVIQQESRDIDVIIENGHQQGADSIRVRKIHVRARGHQQAGLLRPAVPRCI